MKTILTTALALMLTSATPSVSQQIDVSSMTCQQFLQNDDSKIGLIVTWFTGFYAKPKEPQTIDVNALNTVRDRFVAFCKHQPDFRMTTTAEGILGP